MTSKTSPSDVAAPDGLSELSRRDFLRVSGATAAAAAMGATACQAAPESSVPFHARPEEINTLGRARTYATALDGAPVLVKCREGRPILITPNPEVPGAHGLSVRHHAALMDLYDPDRAQGPLSVRRGRGAPAPVGWQSVGDEVVRALAQRKGDAVLLTGPLTGPGTQWLIGELGLGLGLRHVSYAPLACDSARRAWQSAFGAAPRPRPDLRRAELILGLGAEFLDDPSSGLEGGLAHLRPDLGPVRASDPGAWCRRRFVQLEGRLTLTGANADLRLRVRDSQLAVVAAALARVLIVERGLGPLAGDAEVAAALAPFAPAEVARACGLEAVQLARLADALATAGDRALVIAEGSASAGAAGLALETAVLLLNHSLGSYEGPAFAREARRDDGAAVAELATLLEEMKRGQVSTLLLAGVNPVYDAPPALGVAEAMSAVKLVVSLNDRLDETSALADYLAPVSHALEAWGDVDLGGGRVAVQQPVIQPLYDTHGLLDVLLAWGAAAGAGGAIAAAAQAPSAEAAALRYLRAYWKTQLDSASVGFDAVLRAGFLQVALASPIQPDSAAGLAPQALDPLRQLRPSPSQLELQLYPHFALHDGRGANNGWLLELPDPITRLTWGGACSIAPRRFDGLGLENGDRVEVTVGDRRLTLPAYRHAGMHEDQIAIPLGLGRTRCGEIGSNVGVDAFPLRRLQDGRALRSGLPVELRRVPGHEALALAQGADVLDRAQRPLLPVATLSEVRADPRAGTAQPPGGPSAWPDHPYPEQRWGMAIDLSKCNGCAKCVIGCQAENNIPVVGRQNIIDGREMSWIRIDRYYDAPPRPGGWGDAVWDAPLEVVEAPQTLFQPMLCQHCENAPCETVCPFNATMHSSDGLNQQIYNRCVGTRYCANNCPFKVRRYNWHEYSHERTSALFRLLFPRLERHATLNVRGRMQMKNNPEVTVRSRGVMEKCSFCVQRIREARAAAIREGHKGQLADGAVVPACMEACPTGAIVFGDLNDPKSRVQALAGGPRAMRLLASVGVKPVVTYLTRVRNDQA